jgi:hypothetical protein
VQGRHILFLAGPAVAILLVWGLGMVMSGIRGWLAGIKYQVSGVKYDALRFAFHVLLGLLLVGSINQLLFMYQTYPSLLPVRTEPYPIAQAAHTLSRPITLAGGARLIDFSFWDNGEALRVSLIWQAGDQFAPEDYQLELALVDLQGQILSDWRAYQTRARYPTRAWEVGDVVRDEGWLPLIGIVPGQYTIQMRLMGEEGVIVDWESLGEYVLNEALNQPGRETGWILWRDGEMARRPPMLRERETVQFTIFDAQSLVSGPQLIGPDGISRDPVSTGSRWANFIINPDWPAGDYYAAEMDSHLPLFRVVESERDFQIPEIAYPLEVNFENKIKLLGYHLPSRRVEPGDGLPITLYWQGLQWMGDEFVIFDRLLDNQQVVWGGYDRLPQENYSTLFWAPGEIVTDGFAVPIDSDTPDGVYTLSLGWYREIEGQASSLAILDPETNEPTGETALTIGPIKVGGPPPGITVAGAAPSTTVNAMLGEQIKLLGYDFKQNASSLDFIFYWQTLAPPPKDYTVFVHVRNAAGDVVAQQDGPPVEGVYPTSLWDAGEIIQAGISIPLNELAPGQYEVIVGLYDFVTGERLPVAGSAEGAIILNVFGVGK